MNIIPGNQRDDKVDYGLAFVLLYGSVKGNARGPVSPLRRARAIRENK
jgi:hypothetical protein